MVRFRLKKQTNYLVSLRLGSYLIRFKLKKTNTLLVLGFKTN